MNQHINSPTRVLKLWEKGILARGELPFRLLQTLAPNTMEEFARAVSPDVHGMILEAMRDAPTTDADWCRMRMFAAGSWVGPWTEDMAERQRQTEKEEINRYRTGVELLRVYSPCLLTSSVIAASPEWFTSSVLDLAQMIHGSRDFSPMAILADALQDAGCENEDILNHCRSEGPHCRGCFVVDVLLGKE